MRETSDHDVGMTSLLCVSGLESPEGLRDASYHDDYDYHNKVSISHLTTTKESPSIVLSDDDYSKSIHMTSRHNYGNDVSNETSCWLSDAEYSASIISVNNDDYGNKQHHNQQHPRFMDISYKSAQLSDSIYTPSPVRLAHRALPARAGYHRSHPEARGAAAPSQVPGSPAGSSSTTTTGYQEENHVVRAHAHR